MFHVDICRFLANAENSGGGSDSAASINEARINGLRWHGLG